MGTFKWVAGEGAQTAMSTGLNSLGSGNTAISSAIDNLSDLYEYMDLELVLASLTTGSGNPNIAIWILSSVDGTNYEDGTAGTPGVIPNRPPDAIIPLPVSNTGALRRNVVSVPIPPLKIEILLLNSSGAALAASANTLKYNRHNEQVV